MTINLSKDSVSSGAKLYYYADSNSNTVGPMPLDKLILVIDSETLVYCEGIDWTEAKNVPEVAALLGNINDTNPLSNNSEMSNDNSLRMLCEAENKKRKLKLFIVILIINLLYFLAAYNLVDKFVRKIIDPKIDTVLKDTVVGPENPGGNTGNDTVVNGPKQFVYDGENNISYKGNNYSVFSIEFNDMLFDHFSFVRTNRNLKATEFILKQKNIYRNQNIFNEIFDDEDQFFAITGAMYDDSDNLPPGLLVDGGRELKSINFNSGIDGNFFMQPNGVFYINKQQVGISETNSYSSQSPYFAIQSGPLLVENGQIPQSINPSSPNKRIRCGVGVSNIGGKRTIYFICSKSDVSFYELASLFSDKYSCSDALHLESGVFPFIYWPGSNTKSRENIINYIVIR